jgi:protein-disulfide isomerase
MSNQRDREKRREERLEAEAKADSGDRRARLLQFAAGGVFLAIIAIVVVIVIVSSGSSSGGDAANLSDKPEVEKLLAGIPQNSTVLGKPDAPVKLYEYGDLQCSVCKYFSESVLPPIIEKQVKNGEVSITFRTFVSISEESVPAGEAALAAGAQGKGWNYIETWYRNQGAEASGYANEDFMNAMAKYVGVPNLAKFETELKSGKYKGQVEATNGQAGEFGFEGTPSFAIKGPGSEGLELLGTPETTGDIEEAIKQAS